MQGVFYLPQPLVINKGIKVKEGPKHLDWRSALDDVLALRSFHDEYSIWFSVVEDASFPL